MFEIAFERRHAAPVSTVTALGTLDGRSGQHLTEILRMASAARRVVIDLTGVQQMDVAGLAALVGGIGGAREAGVEVELIADSALSSALVDSGVRLVT